MSNAVSYSGEQLLTFFLCVYGGLARGQSW